MEQTIHRFLHSVRLPVENALAAMPHRTELDAKVLQAANSLTTQDPALKCAATTEEGGSVIRLTTPGYEIVVTSRCGQDGSFQQGVKVSFVSYNVSAVSNLKAYDKASAVAEELVVILRIAGAILFAVLLFWGFSVCFKAFGYVRIPAGFLITATIAGGWLGERLGQFVGNWIENRSMAKAEEGGVLPQLETVFGSLEKEVKRILKVYDSV
ncbi:MAG: hypothetical protein JWR26_4487 [Pedosphaera sp.]|nr:hypothetical protein [Pedosphaera sp.]